MTDSVGKRNSDFLSNRNQLLYHMSTQHQVPLDDLCSMFQINRRSVKRIVKDMDSKKEGSQDNCCRQE